MDFFDKLAIDDSTIRRTREGYLSASVRAARSGIQIYTGRQVGKPSLDQVRVWRPEEEVFSKDSMATFGHRPLTFGHPKELVTSKTWRDQAVGNMDGDVARDGEFIRVSVLIMDDATIGKVADGTAELSAGYTCDLAWESGETPQGLKYDAIQRNIRVNHLAVVDTARGGPSLRIGDDDEMANGEGARAPTLRTMLVDGLMVEVTDAGAVAIEKLQGQLAAAVTKMATADVTLAANTTALQAKDGEIAALKVQLAEARITPAMLDAAVVERQSVIDGAKKIVPAFVADGKTVEAIRREVVVTKMGDGAKDAAVFPDTAIRASFDSFVAGAAAPDPTRQMPPIDRLRDGIVHANPAGSKAAIEKILEDEDERLRNAHKTPRAA